MTMNKEMRQELLAYLAETYPNATGVLMDPKTLVFEEAVKQNCYYCGRYGQNWRCPPNLPDVDYPKMMKEFDGGLFVYIPYTYNSREAFDAAIAGRRPGLTGTSGSDAVTLTAPRVQKSQSPFSPMNLTPFWYLSHTCTSVFPPLNE